VISGVIKEHYSLQAFTKNTVLCGGQQGTVSENGHVKGKTYYRLFNAQHAKHRAHRRCAI